MGNKGERMHKLTLHQVAERIGVSHRRIQALVGQKLLNAERFGPIWLVDEKDLAKFLTKWERRPGKKSVKI